MDLEDLSPDIGRTKKEHGEVGRNRSSVSRMIAQRFSSISASHGFSQPIEIQSKFSCFPAQTLVLFRPFLQMNLNNNKS
jgi:hypothetical protein